MTQATRALVTGGAGFIGSHLVDELVRRGVETYMIDNFSTGTPENTLGYANSELVHIMRGDVRSMLGQLRDPQKIDIVFHEAAIASVPTSISNPEFVHDTNVNMTLDLMNFCSRKGIHKFIFASSAAVYGSADFEVEETTICRPASPYGAGKLAIENYLSAYGVSMGLRPVVLRYFNVYGPRQRFGFYSGVITIFIRNILNNRSLTIEGDGRQTRDFVNVKDIVQANILAMESQDAVGEVFNVASGMTTSVLDLVEILKKLSGRNDVECRFVPARAGDVKNGKANIQKIRKTLRYSPKVSMHDGLIDVLDYMRRLQEKVPQIAQ